MDADVIVRAKVRIVNDNFDPQVLAEEIVERGLPPDAEIGHVMVVCEDGRDWEAGKAYKK